MACFENKFSKIHLDKKLQAQEEERSIVDLQQDPAIVKEQKLIEKQIKFGNAAKLYSEHHTKTTIEALQFGTYKNDDGGGRKHGGGNESNSNELGYHNLIHGYSNIDVDIDSIAPSAFLNCMSNADFSSNSALRKKGRK